MSAAVDHDFHDLVNSWLLGFSSAAEQTALRQTLVDPARATEFRQQARMHLLLHARVVPADGCRLAERIHSVLRHGTDSGVQRTVSGVERRMARHRRSPRSGLVGWLVAAGLLFTAGTVAWLAMPPTPPAPGLIVTDGAMTLVRGTSSIWATAGTPVQVGDELRAAEVQAALRWSDDGTMLTLLPGSVLRLRDDTIGKQVELEQGTLRAAVTSQPDDRPLVVVTPQANAIVRGTEFSLKATAHRSELVVEHGQVGLVARTGGAEVSVTDGATAVMEQGWGGPCLVQPTSVRWTDTALDAAGIGLHLSYLDTTYQRFEDVVMPRLRELGLRHVCDGDTTDRFVAQADAMSEAGLQLSWRLDARPDATVAMQHALLRRLRHRPIAMIGPFHPEQQTVFAYAGAIGAIAGCTFHDDVAASLVADPHTADMVIVQPSYDRLDGAVTPLGIANRECFPGDAPPEALIDALPAGPLILNQAGYHITTPQRGDPPSVDAATVAVYLPRLWLAAYERGVERVFLYELLDWADDSDVRWANYGLVRADGRVKPAFTAVANLARLLADPGPALPTRSVALGLGGDRSDLRHLLMAKHDGGLWLALWRARPVFDPRTRSALPDPSTEVTVALPDPIILAELYRPDRTTTPTILTSGLPTLQIGVGSRIVLLHLRTASACLPGTAP